MAGVGDWSWTVPVVGGSPDAWGTILNTLFDDIADDLTAVDGTADTAFATSAAALPKAGGVMTGRVDGHTATIQYDTNATATGALSLDCSSAQWHVLNLTGNVTISASNVPSVSGSLFALVIEITKNAYSVTSWAGLGTIEWAGGSEPTLNGKDVLILITYDGGTNWQGSFLQQDLS